MARPLAVCRLVRIVAALALAPSLALAQRGMGGMGGMGRRGMGGGNRGGNGGGESDALTVPKYVNGVNLLIEHRQDLALTDSQFTKVVAIKRALDSTNAPLLRKIDSVQSLFRNNPMFGRQSGSRRDSLSDARSLIQDVIGTVRDSVGAARDRAFALLSSEQLTKALDFQDKAQKDIDDELQRSKSGRGGFGRPTGVLRQST